MKAGDNSRDTVLPDQSSSAADNRGILQSDNAFWQFSLEVYARAGVAQECLALQEALNVDVNVLLFCAWLGARKLLLTGSDIEECMEAIQTWHNRVVRPLRGMRQQIKGFARHEFEPFRAQVKGLELEAEQIEQSILYNHAQQRTLPTADVESTACVATNVNRFLTMMADMEALRTTPPSAPCLIEAAGQTRAAMTPLLANDPSRPE